MRRILSVSLVMAGVVAAPATATTRRVPSDFLTINAALDVSASGDTVLVAPGTYSQFETRNVPFGTISSVAFLKGGVTLLSDGGRDVTTLRMDGTYPGGPSVCFAYLAIGPMTVEGFTISGMADGIIGVDIPYCERIIMRQCDVKLLGNGSTNAVGLGGIACDMEVYDCRFIDINGGTGGGIFQTSSTLTIEDSEFRNVRSGAIELEVDGTPHARQLTMRRCQFYDNEKTTGSGGAISVGYPQVLIEDCWFENNRSVGSPRSAGAIRTSGSGTVVMIQRSTFIANYTIGVGEGGAIRASGASVSIDGCTFWGNSQELDLSAGGAAVVLEAASNTFLRNIVSNSTGDQAVSRKSGTLTTGCNVYWNNPQGNTSGFMLDATDLIADPLFCDVEVRDVTVNAASPCLPENNPSCDELIGAWEEGCGSISIEPESWGRVKNMYRAEPEGK